MAKYYPSVVVIVILVQPLGSETQMSKNSLPPSTDVLGEETQLISSDNVHDGMDISEVLLTTHSRIGIKGKESFITFTTLLRIQGSALMPLDYIGQGFCHGEKMS